MVAFSILIFFLDLRSSVCIFTLRQRHCTCEFVLHKKINFHDKNQDNVIRFAVFKYIICIISLEICIHSDMLCRCRCARVYCLVAFTISFFHAIESNTCGGSTYKYNAMASLATMRRWRWMRAFYLIKSVFVLAVAHLFTFLFRRSRWERMFVCVVHSHPSTWFILFIFVSCILLCWSGFSDLQSFVLVNFTCNDSVPLGSSRVLLHLHTSIPQSTSYFPLLSVVFHLYFFELYSLPATTSTLLQLLLVLQRFLFYFLVTCW